MTTLWEYKKESLEKPLNHSVFEDLSKMFLIIPISSNPIFPQATRQSIAQLLEMWHPKPFEALPLGPWNTRLWKSKALALAAPAVTYLPTINPGDDMPVRPFFRPIWHRKFSLNKKCTAGVGGLAEKKER